MFVLEFNVLNSRCHICNTTNTTNFHTNVICSNRIIFKYGFNSDNDNTLELSRRNFKGGDSVLDSLKIPRSAKLLVLDSHSPNLAFTSMKRSGYCVMTTSYANIERAMKWDYDYIITQNFSLLIII